MARGSWNPAIIGDELSFGWDHGETPGEEEGREVATEFMLRSPSPLFSYQREIVADLAEWIGAQESSPAALVSLPTGGGKTRTGLWFARRQIESGAHRRLVWVAPSSELVQQAVETAKSLWADYPVGPEVRVCVNSLAPRLGRSTTDAEAAFVTAQLAARRLDDLRRFAADLLVFDEAHQAVARTFQSIVRCQLEEPGRRVIGLSATPGRVSDEEGDDLQDLFGDKLITSRELGPNPVAALCEKGVLARLEINLIDLPRQWQNVRVTAATGKKSLSVDELALNAPRFWATVRTLESLPTSAKTLVFGASLAHCYALTGALQAKNIKAATVSHRTPPQRRSSLLAKFAAGEISVLLNKTLLGTGFDCPAITDIVLATPIRSAIQWEQILGRASRGPAVGGTKAGQIWELDDHRRLHGKVLSYARFLGQLWS